MAGALNALCLNRGFTAGRCAQKLRAHTGPLTDSLEQERFVVRTAISSGGALSIRP